MKNLIKVRNNTLKIKNHLNNENNLISNEKEKLLFRYFIHYLLENYEQNWVIYFGDWLGCWFQFM